MSMKRMCAISSGQVEPESARGSGMDDRVAQESRADHVPIMLWRERRQVNESPESVVATSNLKIISLNPERIGSASTVAPASRRLLRN